MQFRSCPSFLWSISRKSGLLNRKVKKMVKRRLTGFPNNPPIDENPYPYQTVVAMHLRAGDRLWFKYSGLSEPLRTPEHRDGKVLVWAGHSASPRQFDRLDVVKIVRKANVS